MSEKLKKLIDQLDMQNMPKHIAIIMDGNGRWAKKKFKPRFFGHNEGVKTVRRICEICGDLKKIEVLTVYAFSTENWKRSSKEIKVLMHLLRSFLENEIDEMNSNNIRLETIGRIDEFPDYIKKNIEKAKKLTKQNDGFILNLAINYSGRTEIVDTVNKLLKSGITECSDSIITNELYTKNYPDPDLLIRTSGEMRISNFLLWQLAYSEIWVTETLWPDFSKEEFVQAILDYQKRNRRFGGI
jgi:undecaprenyl diphosphate synthase